MWLMFCSNPNPIEVTFRDIVANDTQVRFITLSIRSSVAAAHYGEFEGIGTLGG